MTELKYLSFHSGLKLFGKVSLLYHFRASVGKVKMRGNYWVTLREPQ